MELLYMSYNNIELIRFQCGIWNSLCKVNTPETLHNFEFCSRNGNSLNLKGILRPVFDYIYFMNSLIRHTKV